MAPSAHVPGGATRAITHFRSRSPLPVLRIEKRVELYPGPIGALPGIDLDVS